MNLYQYTFNSPSNWVDPYGLCGEKPWWEELWEKLNNIPPMSREELMEIAVSMTLGPQGGGAIVTRNIVRSMTQRSKYLKSIIDISPRWMRQWLQRGKVPPGYQVHHNRPLYLGGKDAPQNMRLIDIDMHKIVTRLWRNIRK